MIKKSQAELFLINETVNKHFSNLDTPSGITALYRIKTKDLNNTKPIIYLNSINDPGNLGTIIRSMLAFGFDNLVMDEHCADPYNPKTISSAKNSIFEINTFKDKNFEFLQSTKLPIYVSLPGKGEDIKSFQPESNYILIIGSESHGADKDIIELAKKKINIKINKQIESLNASVATSIMLYELSNKQ
ncbi:hypothetical protein C0583_03365 [Candidatus Parcubacteria bacterium]|nr:MAG: hypothetical protein C0583_03365 [Candidatus Parcubacteria bacterium]